MTNVKYHCPAFSLPIHGLTLTLAADLDLQSGDVCALFSSSDALVQEFLYLLAGLHRIRALTTPAAGGYGRTTLEAPVPNITLCGLPIYSYSPQQRALQIAVIYENPEVAIIGRTVIDEFQYSFAACGQPRPIGGAMCLEPYGLQYKVDRDTDTLSGGERHRLNCACALEVKPKMIVADFTASNLDSDFFDDFLQNLGNFAAKGGIVLVAGVRSDQLPRLSAAPKLLCFDPSTGTVAPTAKTPAEYLTPTAEHADIKAALGSREVQAGGVLTARNLAVHGRTHVPFSATLHRGEIIICSAKNGFGKTTIANVLAKRLKPSRGEMEMAPKRPTLAIQHSERSLLQASVELALGHDARLAELCGFSKSELRLHPRELCRAKQKLLSVAVALAASDGVAILDEPTCGMDIQTKERLAQLLASFPELGVIIFTHDPALIGLGTSLSWS